jgi:hypothetical protein
LYCTYNTISPGHIWTTFYIAIWCTYRTLLSDIVSTIVEALVVAGHSFCIPAL